MPSNQIIKNIKMTEKDNKLTEIEIIINEVNRMLHGLKKSLD